MTNLNHEKLKQTKGFVFDMDGTLILGDKKNNNMNTLPGAAEFITLLRENNIPYVVMTNGTARSPRDYVKVLSEAGIPMDDSTMMTPSSVAAEYLVQQGYKRVMVLGCPGAWEPLAELGLDVVLSSIEDPGPVDAVYIGWYREFGFKDIENAWLAVRDGAELFTASDVPFFATANGPGIGTSCALAAALKPLTGKDAIVLGKPSSIAIESAARHLGLAVNEIAVVGDDADLEVPMAINNGALSIYVHTGTGGPNAFDERDKSTWPHISIANVGELVALYQDDK
jgi:HAD superfamily hydrolase (TIGR01450 family)